MNLKQLKTITRPGMYATPQRTLYVRVANGRSRQWMQRLTVESASTRRWIGTDLVRRVVRRTP